MDGGSEQLNGDDHDDEIEKQGAEPWQEPDGSARAAPAMEALDMLEVPDPIDRER